MKSYEIQFRRDGAWKTELVHEDRESALSEARRIDQKAKRNDDGLRVVETYFDERTQEYKHKTIFRDAKFQKQMSEKIQNSREAGKPAPKAKKTVQTTSGNRKRSSTMVEINMIHTYLYASFLAVISFASGVLTVGLL